MVYILENYIVKSGNFMAYISDSYIVYISSMYQIFTKFMYCFSHIIEAANGHNGYIIVTMNIKKIFTR